MKTLKLLIKASFFNKINDFMCFRLIDRVRWSSIVHRCKLHRPRVNATNDVIEGNAQTILLRDNAPNNWPIGDI